MRMIRIALGLVSVCASVACGAGLQPRTWTVDGVRREALVHIPDTAKTTAAPLVFVWHGHGGGMRISAWSFPVQARWPEAIVVHPQGLPTPSLLVDPEGKKSGWQQKRGEQGDRDIRFFDAMLKSLKEEYKVDERSIFCAGYSNGGMMTFLLWSVYPETFRAFAPCACVSLPVVQLSVPKPAFFLMGETDTVVKPEWMRETAARLRRLNKCEDAGKPWSPDTVLYPSPVNAPLAVLTHSGGHTITLGGKVDDIVRFFKEQLK